MEGNHKKTALEHMGGPQGSEVSRHGGGRGKKELPLETLDKIVPKLVKQVGGQ